MSSPKGNPYSRHIHLLALKVLTICISNRIHLRSRSTIPQNCFIPSPFNGGNSYKYQSLYVYSRMRHTTAVYLCKTAIMSDSMEWNVCPEHCRDGMRGTVATHSRYVICARKRLGDRLDVLVIEVLMTWSRSPIEAFVVRMTLQGCQRDVNPHEWYLPCVDHIQRT